MKPGRQINQELFEYALNSNSTFKPQIAQIADERSAVETLQQQKFTQEGTGINLRRYRIRICSMHDDNTPIEQLPFAYGQSPTSGLRGESSGAPIYAENTFVTVFQDPDTGLYYIDDVHPNSVAKLPETKEPGCSPASGFVPGSALFFVPETHYKDGRLVEGAEWFNTPRPSQSDEKQNKLAEDPPIVLPSKCRKVNTEAINSEITKLIKDIQALKSNLTGKDSFLSTSQDFLNDVQFKVSQASANIANWVTAAIQEMRRWVTRKVNALSGDLTGNAPLSNRLLVNQATKESLNLISCLFIRLLANLENIIAQILNAIIDKVINTAQCVLENLLGNLLGQILSQLTSAINAILGPLSALIGSVISFTNELLDFAISILDFLTCKIENVCPVTEKWNILEGGQPISFNIDFNKVFQAAKSVVDSAVGVINIPKNLDNFNFTVDANAAFLAAAGCLGFGPESCGPPNVVFWGGSGSGGLGNAVLNAAGDIIGVDIIAPGNYTSAPVINFEDNCGNGVGAYGIPILGEIEVPAGGGEGGADGEGGAGAGGGGGAAGAGGGGGVGAGTSTITGIIAVAMPETGYGYLPVPDGSKGGMNRTWADRCQTVVKRANGDWDPPLSYEEPIKLFFGDMIQLPGKEEVYIDCNFTADKLPGCNVVGTLTCLKSMIGFDDNKGIPFRFPRIKSMVGFDDSPGADQGKPNQFGYLNDYPSAKKQGFSDADIRFYLENEYKGKIGPEMQKKLNDPTWGRLDDVNTIRSMRGFSDFRGSTPENSPPISPEHQKKIDAIVKTTDYKKALEEEQLLIKQGILTTAEKGRADQFGFTYDYPYAKSLGYTDQDIRFYLEGFYTKVLGKRVGPLMQAVLNDPNFGPLPKYITDNGAAGVFDYQNDYPYAVSLGFTDQDIRYYLENVYPGIIAADMQIKLNDSNWGKIPEFYVTITAPDCPPLNPPTNNNYEVITEIGDVYIPPNGGGFGFAPDDTVTALDCAGNPDAATKIEIDVDANGAITKATVVQSGTNFTCIPELRLNTKTGHNAILKPILKFRRVTPDDKLPEGTVPLQVIDCVGRV